jgi:uncharacterized protein YdeI (YjbR/CyaY-like superfamily)
MNAKVDSVIKNAESWQQEFEKLRNIILGCGLKEELKWGQPCYTYQDSNVVLIHGFKEYCAILFFKGALLNDPHGILVQQTKNVQAARQVRFTNVREITKLRSILQTYILQAIEVEKAGLKVNLKKTSDFTVADEFKKKLDAQPKLKKAFNELTPGRQKAYLLYFSSPKQSKTRESRIEKSVQAILNGKGLND